MKKIIVVVLMPLLMFLSGCTFTGRLYPVQGPLAGAASPPIFIVRVTAHPPTALTIIVVLNNEERVTGTLTRVFPGTKPLALPSSSMSEKWDSIYGQGSYIATVLGQGQDAQGMLTGSSGTIMEMELHTSDSPNRSYNNGTLRGVAQDNRGNLYKVAF